MTNRVALLGLLLTIPACTRSPEQTWSAGGARSEAYGGYVELGFLSGGDVVAGGGFADLGDVGFAVVDRYDSTGARVWRWTDANPDTKRGVALVVDADDSILFLTEWHVFQTGADGTWAPPLVYYGLTRLSADGVELWSRTLEVAELYDVALAPGGEIVLAGAVKETFAEGPVSLTAIDGVDAMLLVLDRDGEALRGYTYDGPSGVLFDDQRFFQVEVDREGRMVVVAAFEEGIRLGSETWSTFDSIQVVASLSASGELVWSRPLGGVGTTLGLPMAMTPAGELAVTTQDDPLTGSVRRLTRDGDEIWSTSTLAPGDVGVSPTGEVVIVEVEHRFASGVGDEGDPPPLWTVRALESDDGGTVWELDHGEDGIANPTFRSDGAVLVTSANPLIAGYGP